MKTWNRILLPGACFWAIAFLLGACKASSTTLLGSWDNGAGQRIIFQPDSVALWVINDPAARDTFRLRYATNFGANPPQLDLLGFDRGPLNGRNLYGIIALQDKKTMVVDFAPGPTASVRPTAFNPSNAQTYTKKKK
jgi:hypothetical protein